MSQVDAPRGRTCSRTLRSVALLTSGVLALPVLAGCSADESERTGKALAPDIAAATRGKVADGGTLRWAVDAMPSTLNAFQADADAATAQIAGAVLPALFTLDENGLLQRNPDFLESAKIVDREPKQVVLYKLNQKAVWSDGREIGAPTSSPSGGRSAARTAPSGPRATPGTSGSRRSRRARAIWRSRSPSRSRTPTGRPSSARCTPRRSTRVPERLQLRRGQHPQDHCRTVPPGLAGPEGRKGHTRPQSALVGAAGQAGQPGAHRSAAGRSGQPRWPPAAWTWPRSTRGTADRIVRAAKVQGANGRPNARSASAAPAPSALKSYVVRKSLEPAYTQLALNGESGPLADVRVRRAVARALDREELAETVLDPLGLPADPPGSHLALAGQRAYTDNSGALGDQNTQEAQALLADAGWTPGGAVKKPAPAKAGPSGSPLASGSPSAAPKKAKPKPKESENSENKAADTTSDEGTYVVGDDKPAGGHGPESGGTLVWWLLLPPRTRRTWPCSAGPGPWRTRPGAPRRTRRAEPPGPTRRAARLPPRRPAAGSARTASRWSCASSCRRDRAPSRCARSARRSRGCWTGWASTPRSPRSPTAATSRTTSRRATTTWPSTPGRPAPTPRPTPGRSSPARAGHGRLAAGGAEHTRVGSDYIDQLFDQAASELDQDEARDLVRRADARIWAAAGSIPLYQRPDVVAAKRTVLNAGAFGFTAPRYQDIGFRSRKPPRLLRGSRPGTSELPQVPCPPATPAGRIMTTLDPGFTHHIGTPEVPPAQPRGTPTPLAEPLLDRSGKLIARRPRTMGAAVACPPGGRTGLRPSDA